MTTNATIKIDSNSWVNLQTEAGVAVGTTGIAQANGPDSLVFVNATTEPTDKTTGGYILSGIHKAVSLNPSGSEYTFAIALNSSGTNIRVQF